MQTMPFEISHHVVREDRAASVGHALPTNPATLGAMVEAMGGGSQQELQRQQEIAAGGAKNDAAATQHDESMKALIDSLSDEVQGGL